MKILIAEDERITRKILTRLLEKSGYECIAVENGALAWEILSDKDAPPIALLDWMMPGMSGIDLCKKLREQIHETYTYTILVTGKTSKEDVVNGINAGADDYVTKPVNHQELLARLRTAERVVKLLRTEKKMQSLGRAVEQGSSTIVITDTAGLIEYVNPQFEKITGYTTEEALGKNPSILNSGHHSAEFYQEMWQTLKSGKNWRGEIVNKKKDGTEYWESVVISPVHDKKGNIRQYVAVKDDITKQRKLQESLFAAQKLESIGRLSAGVAHEINTPTQFIRNNLFFLQESFQKIAPILRCELQEPSNPPTEQSVATPPPEPNMEELAYLIEDIPQVLVESIDGIDQITKIIRAIGRYVHPGRDEKELSDVTELIEGCIAMTQHAWKPITAIQREYAKSTPTLRCNPSELQQAIINLIVNAVHALEERDQSTTENKIIIQTLYDENCVQIVVEDTGSGISSENLTRIFDPFFTTKTFGKGTGQGLALTHSIIIEQHGGTIDVVSEINEGTRFVLSIPHDETIA